MIFFHSIFLTKFISLPASATSAVSTANVTMATNTYRDMYEVLSHLPSGTLLENLQPEEFDILTKASVKNIMDAQKFAKFFKAIGGKKTLAWTKFSDSVEIYQKLDAENKEYFSIVKPGELKDESKLVFCEILEKTGLLGISAENAEKFLQVLPNFRDTLRKLVAMASPPSAPVVLPQSSYDDMVRSATIAFFNSCMGFLGKQRDNGAWCSYEQDSMEKSGVLKECPKSGCTYLHIHALWTFFIAKINMETHEWTSPSNVLCRFGDKCNKTHHSDNDKNDECWRVHPHNVVDVLLDLKALGDLAVASIDSIKEVLKNRLDLYLLTELS